MPPKSAGKSPLALKRSYTLRDLPIKQQRSVRRYLLELEQNADKLESLKRPGEYWYFTLYGNRSQMFDSLSLAAPEMLKWATSAQQPNHGKSTDDQVIHGIKLVKFRGKGVQSAKEQSDIEFEQTEQQFSAMRKQAREEHKRQKQEVMQEVKTLTKTRRKKNQGPVTTTQLLFASRDSLKAAQAEIARLKAMLGGKSNAKKKPANKKGSGRQKAAKKVQSKKTSTPTRAKKKSIGKRKDKK